MKVLFLTHRLPYAPNRGDRIRAHYILRTLGRDAEVHLASLVHSAAEARQAGAIGPVAASVTVARVPRVRNVLRAAAAFAGDRPLTHVLLDAPRLRPMLERLVERVAPDVVLAYCSGMAPYAMDLADAGIPFVLDMVDVDSCKWQALAETTRGWRSAVYAREARVLRTFESAAVRRAAATIVINERERAALAAATDAARRVLVAPNGVDVEYFQPADVPSAARRVVFCGVMDYAPNVDAAEWLAAAIWPLVRRRMPEATLAIAGANPVGRVRRLADTRAGVEVTGPIDDMRPALWQSALAVAPLRIARGMQTKVVEAIAAGIPAVVTPAVAAGLTGAVAPAVRVADTAEAFADTIVGLLRLDPRERRRLAGKADVGGFRFDQMLRPIVDALREAARKPAATGGAAA